LVTDLEFQNSGCNDDVDSILGHMRQSVI
jgi:hypothetical protein